MPLGEVTYHSSPNNYLSSQEIDPWIEPCAEYFDSEILPLQVKKVMNMVVAMQEYKDSHSFAVKVSC